jgi:hypothetical protein
MEAIEGWNYKNNGMCFEAKAAAGGQRDGGGGGGGKTG